MNTPAPLEAPARPERRVSGVDGIARESGHDIERNAEVDVTDQREAARDPRAIASFAEFYPYYLSEHSHRVCRRLHFVGSTLTLVCLSMLLATGRPQYLLYGLLCGYGCAWIGHFGFEKNKPASFKRPLWSFMGDWVMYRDMWRGRITF